ncbi:ParA family protein [Duganella sp. BuS-21]|uniref:ParA family protein n=1 Tax=Duganella sp. BuS-21 TaxID=2943848 RepID=UPI0035A7124C
MAAVVAVANQKGGVGKTFVACQLSFYTARAGARTLLLELDQQMNASRSLIRGGRVAVAGFTMLDVLEGREGVLPEGDLVLVPGHGGLGALERQPARHNDFVNALQRFLAAVGKDFAVCVMDTNPSPDVRYAAALATADFLLAPVQLNQEAIDGIESLMLHKRYGFFRMRELLNPKLELIGILPNLVEATPFQRANLQQLVLRHPGLLIPVVRGQAAGYAYVPTRTAIAEAQAAGVPLWELRQTSPAEASPCDGVEGKVLQGRSAMPLRSAARDAWREIRPSFDAITARLLREV